MPEWIIAAARAAHLAAVFAAFGALLFRPLVAEPSLPSFRAAATRLAARLARVSRVSLAAALVAALVRLLVQATDIAGTGLAGIVSALPSVLIETEFGHVFLLHFGLLVIAGATCLAASGLGRAGHWVAPASAGGAILCLAAIGHAAAVEGSARPALLFVQASHLLAGASWLGTLYPLFLLLGECAGTPPAYAAARRFSRIGVAAVATLAASATVNAWVLVGSLAGLFGTAYGYWALIKTGLFAAMVGLAAANRNRFTPALAASRPIALAAAYKLRRTIAVEIALGIGVLIAAGALATSPPAEHTQPWWPFSVRLSGELLYDPDLRVEILLNLAAAVAGLALAIAGLLRRSLRLAVPLGALVLIWFLQTPFYLLTVAAVPTSFYESPTGYTAQSVADGERLFAGHCVSCHGPRGRGEPYARPGLAESLTDLTAAHVYDHPDGDLFWWIGEGIPGTEMPGQKSVLTEDERWSLVDFIHANADAARFAGQRSDPPPRPIPAPDFAVACPDGGATVLSDLAGRLTLLVFPDAAGRAKRLAELAANTGGIEVVVAAPQVEASLAGVCTADPAEITSAYALFRGGPDATLAGTAFLIEAGGGLRGASWPGGTPDWSDPIAFAAAVQSILAGPQPVGQVRLAHHHH